MKGPMRFLLGIILAGLVLGLTFTAFGIAQAKEKIIWPYVCFKPVYICEDNKLAGGIGFQVMKLIWKNMPEYEHVVVKMPIKRILEHAKQGEHQLFYGLYKTPERQQYLVYSLPCRISTPTYLVVRKADIMKFGDGKTVSPLAKR